MQTQASPDISAADSDYSLSNHHMLDCIKAGHAHDDLQCGSPDSEKLWPHMYADNGLWIHHSCSIFVPDYDTLRQEIISELHDSLYAGHPGMRITILLVKRYFWRPTLDRDCSQRLCCMPAKQGSNGSPQSESPSQGCSKRSGCQQKGHSQCHYTCTPTVTCYT